ncbi:ferredoxin-type protein NapG [Serratia sp. JSRIV001]|jgi:ferredoxin-type protein NapG|uniref:Ferredoxin-type protein NapG n=1 Tax=Serratia fonticola TaxID=47917 RepID=A0A0U4A2Y9_SERFO|nr:MULTISPECIES: ferredoxin-type protein NapG [Serratia]ERK09260.1 Ferredoxin-type protein NapG (periplasmic nitrate reductase) [Serratia fonticola AU-AP2C]ALX96200.1 quinol dehydrogenase [Serratia fonticola]ATM77481.1 ferredoxin-type protein NapG [Serratia fonticola]MBC3227376.1 ferredoxin-type protein NapG [Serratia fonticola]MBC3249686.1 ferredoxin-type protein NapG [Serratia fonticola]
MSQQRDKTPARRRFLRDAARSVAGLAGIGVLLGLQQKQSQARDGLALRPPGALAEGAFDSACIRCGQCVQACPYQTLKLATLLSPRAAGTPYFVARDIPCEMCEDIPCVVACPSGALDPNLTDIDQARMGLAVLLDHENCLNWQGLRCDVCYRVCPQIDKAITLDLQHNERTGKHAMFLPTVHSQDCTGCGKCEQACVLEQAAIKVLPMELARGQLGEHYRWGWQEKQRAGHSLVPEGLTLPARGVKGGE